MILETGRVVAIEPQGLWVETIQRSACGSCHAKQGCGHSALARFGVSASRLWVLLDGRNASEYPIGSEVKIGVPEDVIASGSLFVYMVPLVTMITATFTAHQFFLNDGLTALCALFGLLGGAAIVRVVSYVIRFDRRLQPVLIDEQSALQIVEICARE